MNPLTRLVAVVVAILTLTSVLAPIASAAIRITKIYYDSPGSDGGSNSSLNAEWIRLKNTGSSSRSLKNWTIRDKAGHVYRFGTYRLGAGKTVTVHTGRGSNSARHRYWQQDRYVWNNDGDRARLKKPNGTTADSCAYSGAGSSVTC
jgi:Lamin Tail Domain